MCSFLWVLWILWTTQRECRILGRRWGSMRRVNGRAKDSLARGRTRLSWTKERRRALRRCGGRWGFNGDAEETRRYREKNGRLRMGNGNRPSVQGKSTRYAQLVGVVAHFMCPM